MVAAMSLLAACKKQPAAPKAAAPEMTVTTVVQRATPVDFEFTAQTQSSREVEIRAQVVDRIKFVTTSRVNLSLESPSVRRLDKSS
jgi:multidrug efflux pump subunit AcrA (membrane-fusion protein)